ncbi:biotin-dependent carboxyltransferase [Sporolactobacillus sp. THM7-4]|nr:biotin-dependent carboxyltransferase [Sporolactobacillus sp. THM7-4]
MTLLVNKPGMLSTIQDLGRNGWQKAGVSTSGAMDSWALRLANALVGNEPGAACLEITLSGPELCFEEGHWIAITGADLSPVIGDRRVPMNRPVYVRKGTVLAFTVPVKGLRTYLAVDGGIDVPEVLGSRSTALQAQFGGLNGRAIQSGDRLPAGRKSAFPHRLLQKDEAFYYVNWTVNPRLLPYHHPRLIRVVAGREWAAFSKPARRNFLYTAYEVTRDSNRMGARLSGLKLELKKEKSLISSPVSVGTVQVPANGQPILLLQDRQTTGGYPMIAHVISADLPKAAQARPGDKLSFRKVSLEEAQRLLIDQEKKLQSIIRSIRIKRSEF